jgi:hypothetical protein
MPFSFQLDEAGEVDGVFKLKGLFHLAEIKNANGRVYSKSLLERELEKIKPAIKGRQVVGELDHPMDPAIKLQGAAHVITELKMEGNKVFGVLEALKTPNGRVLQGLIESGVKLGISSRGVGSLQENKDGIKVVQEDYQLITWDVVPNPSTPDAWLSENEMLQLQQGAITEKYSKENDFVKFGGESTEIAEDSKIKDIKQFDQELFLREQISKKFGGL